MFVTTCRVNDSTVSMAVEDDLQILHLYLNNEMVLQLKKCSLI